MADLKQFSATTKKYELTETEVIQLKNKLFTLRKQYVQKIWEPQLDMVSPSLSELEDAINEVEHMLAHTIIK